MKVVATILHEGAVKLDLCTAHDGLHVAVAKGQAHHSTICSLLVQEEAVAADDAADLL